LSPVRTDPCGIEFAIETAVLLNHLERQIEFRHAAVKHQFLNVKARESWQLLWHVLKNEHDLEDRRMAAMTLRPQMPYKLFYRNVLVGQRTQNDFAHSREHRGKAGIVRQVCPHYYRIDEAADQITKIPIIAARHRRSNRNVLAAGVASEQDLQDREQAHVERAPRAPARLLEAGSHIALNAKAVG
jgi:hypothetical protein